jgi:hypothetical protein
MKIRALALVFLAFFPVLALGATVTVNWTAPTTAIDGSPLTGSQAITSYQVWLGTSSIAANTTSQPTATVTGSATATTQTVTASPGQTIFARVKACNSGGCSAMSAEASKLVPVSEPGVPTSVTITLQITP